MKIDRSNAYAATYPKFNFWKWLFCKHDWSRPLIPAYYGFKNDDQWTCEICGRSKIIPHSKIEKMRKAWRERKQ